MSDRAEDIDPTTITGAVGRVLYSNEENGWCALRLQPEDGDSLTAVGPLLGVRQGDEIRLSGRWVRHTKYGDQFEVESYVHVAPSTLEGLRRFLGSGKIRGIGPARAAQVVDRFGLDTLEILDREPDRLLEIRGIGPATVDRVALRRSVGPSATEPARRGAGSGEEQPQTHGEGRGSEERKGQRQRNERPSRKHRRQQEA